MSDMQKQLLDTFEQAIPNMPDFDLGYVLGKSEAYVDKLRKEEKQEAEANGGESKCRY